MKPFAEICHQLSAGEFEFSRHAFKRVVERNISNDEITQLSEKAELIENYPEDKFSPSCLILGFTHKNRLLHIQVSFADTPLIRIITLYEPDPKEWIEFRKRR